MVIRASNPNREHNNLIKADEAKNTHISRIASGKKINKASDDPAGLSMVMAFESQTRSLIKQIGTRQDEISMFQTAEGALDSTSQMLQRMNELAVQASNGTLTDDDRSNIQLEAGQLREQINQTAVNTIYNDKKLLDGSLKANLQGGETFSIAPMTSDALGLDSLDLSTAEGAAQAISITGRALDSLSSQRNSLGAAINGISSQVSSLQNEFVNATSAQSRIEDADMAAEIINLSLTELQSKFAIKAFKMQDENRATILNLLND